MSFQQKGCYSWAWATLDKHRHDKREYLYTKEEFETAQTHEDIWNAAQVTLQSQIRKKTNYS